MTPDPKPGVRWHFQARTDYTAVLKQMGFEAGWHMDAFARMLVEAGARTEKNVDVQAGPKVGTKR